MKDACDNVTKLCQLLHTEVCRNGGFITQICQLKIHASESSARRMTKLLGQLPPTHTYTSDVAVGTGTSKTTGKKSGIVSVLQRFPNLFLVDVNRNPHLVQLNVRVNHHGSENGCPCGHCHDTATDGDGDGDGDGHDQEVNSAAAKLTERILYILKQRECKIARRRNRHTSDANDPVFVGAKPPTLGWVAKKVLLELHRYVRLLGPSKRPTVRVDQSIGDNNNTTSFKAVELFGEEWWTLSIPLLYELLQQESVPIVTLNSANPAPVVGYPTEKNHARKRMGTKMHPNSLGEITTVTLRERVGNHDIQSNPCVLKTEPFVAGSIATRVRTILQNNPAVAVGGMDVGRLLSDPKLRQLLGGHDFCRMVEADRDHPSPVFEGLVLFREDGRGLGANLRIGLGPLALSSKPGTLRSPGTVPCGNEQCNKHRLETGSDEVGLYSLTARRTALAMANGLSNALFLSRPQEANGDHPPTTNVTRCRRSTNQTVLPATEMEKQKNGPYSTKSICIDMTAGIGGNTIACSRYFARVVSYEIDPARANLCQRNVNNFARNDVNETKGIVDITCANSLEMLPQLAQKYRAPSSNPDIGFTGIAVILDPPWGGRNYKRAARNHSEDDGCDMGLGLGPNAPLAKVLMDISHHLAPLVIGLKVPLEFAVNDFTDTIGRNRKGIVNADNDDTSPATANNRQKKYIFDVVSIKKYPRQLFVVYNVKPTTE